MPDLLTPTFLTALLTGGLLAAVPLMFASLGEMLENLRRWRQLSPERRQELRERMRRERQRR